MDRRRDVPVRVRIAVQHPAKRTAYEEKVRKIDRPHNEITRAIEIKRDEQATGAENPIDLVHSGAERRHVSQPVAGRDDVELVGGKRKRHHVGGHEEG
jgi:hypothetical protein